MPIARRPDGHKGVNVGHDQTDQRGRSTPTVLLYHAVTFSCKYTSAYFVVLDIFVTAPYTLGVT